MDTISVCVCVYTCVQTGELKLVFTFTERLIQTLHIYFSVIPAGQSADIWKW